MMKNNFFIYKLLFLIFLFILKYYKFIKLNFNGKMPKMQFK